MAEIDKTLPNIMNQLTPEQETEQVVADTEILNPSGETEILENEDGSVEVNFDPNQLQNIEADHSANLAEFIEESSLGTLGSTLYQNYQDYKKLASDLSEVEAAVLKSPVNEIQKRKKLERLNFYQSKEGTQQLLEETNPGVEDIGNSFNQSFGDLIDE